MKKTKKMVSVTAVITVAASLLIGCGGSGDSGATTAAEAKTAETTATQAGTKAAQAETTEATTVEENPVAGEKVAYIILLPSATIFQMWKNSYTSLYDALDVKFDFFFCDGDFNRWQGTIHACASTGYEGLLVNHGNQDGSYIFLKETTEQYPDLGIVTFDTQLYTDGKYQKSPGVTQMFQQDESLITILLNQMIEEYGEGARLIRVQRDPNYNSPFDRREVGWQGYETEDKIVTVGEVQPLQDSVDSANTVTAAYLQGVNHVNVDGIIAYYDLYGQGVYSTIAENNDFNGKNGDALPMTSVDIDPVDITNAQTRSDTWTAAGITDWIMNGEIGMHVLMLQSADQYDKIFDPATGENGVDAVKAPGTAIKAGALQSDSIAENLGITTGETYGNLDYLSKADRMPKDLIY